MAPGATVDDVINACVSLARDGTRSALEAVVAAAKRFDDWREAIGPLREAVALVEEWHPEVEVVTRAPQGLAQEVLLDEARDAGLLVVGSRGQGGFAGLELGSVSRSLLRQADLTVAVVRDGGI